MEYTPSTMSRKFSAPPLDFSLQASKKTTTLTKHAKQRAAERGIAPGQVHHRNHRAVIKGNKVVTVYKAIKPTYVERWMELPDGMNPLTLIGNGGETAKTIRSRSGVKVFTVKVKTRRVFLVGTQSAVAKAAVLVKEHFRTEATVLIPDRCPTLTLGQLKRLRVDSGILVVVVLDGGVRLHGTKATVDKAVKLLWTEYFIETVDVAPSEHTEVNCDALVNTHGLRRCTILSNGAVRLEGNLTSVAEAKHRLCAPHRRVEEASLSKQCHTCGKARGRAQYHRFQWTQRDGVCSDCTRNAPSTDVPSLGRGGRRR